MKHLPKFGAVALLGLLIVTAGCRKGQKNITPIPGVRDGGAPTTSLAQGDLIGSRQPAFNPPPGNRFGGTDPGLTGSDIGGAGGSKIADPNGSTPLPSADDFYGLPADRAQFAGNTVYFDFDKSAIKSDQKPNVAVVADYLKSKPDTKLAIEGHCDERGTEEYNRALGERRALSVREMLLNLGISSERVITRSFGEDKPADTEHNDAAWSKNRRAEFILLLPAGSVR
jgi:peptidoglycan-associated lipoprotein